MKINAIQCKKCDDIVYSRATHDYRPCSCGLCAIDGGFDYTRIAFQNREDYVSITIDLPVTKEQLFADWNNRRDEFGIIKDKNTKSKFG